MTSSPAVLLLFVDGLGIGSRGPHNPLDGLSDSEPLAVFQNEISETIFDGIVVATDPRLGVPGRPQSASGQTTILTGINAPQLLGYHKQGFPNEEMRQIIHANSIYLQLLNAGVSEITFANAYRDRFFSDRPRWISATTAAVEAAQLPFRTIDDLRAGHALYQDFTNGVLIENGVDVQRRTAIEAADVLASIVASHRFTLYEYFLTDKIGHAQDFAAASVVLRGLATLVREVLKRVDLGHTTVILTSDHGNIEDLSVRNHTINDVPTFVWGAARKHFAERIVDLSDITPGIMEILTSHTK